jgi:hypothetical protein
MAGVVWETGLRHWRIIMVVFWFNFVAAFFEGGTFGILTVALSILTAGGDPNSLLQKLGPVAHLFPDNLSQDQLFVTLICKV